MGKFCSNCGEKINEGQQVCLGCGRILNQDKIKNNSSSHHTYNNVIGWISIVLGAFFLISYGYSTLDNAVGMFALPGLFCFIAGITQIIAKKNSIMYVISGILLILGALFNITAIVDVSLFTIYAIIIAVVDFLYYLKK